MHVCVCLSGDAVLFWSLKLDSSSEDFRAEHAGCPVVRGVKWAAPVWIHIEPFNPEGLGFGVWPRQPA
jgi:prolyl 4-hydroxylase